MENGLQGKCFVTQRACLGVRPPTCGRTLDQSVDLAALVSTDRERELTITNHPLQLEDLRADASSERELCQERIDMLSPIATQRAIKRHLTNVLNDD